jgi:hypothetical protein
MRICVLSAFAKKVGVRGFCKGWVETVLRGLIKDIRDIDRWSYPTLTA